MSRQSVKRLARVRSSVARVARQLATVALAMVTARELGEHDKRADGHPHKPLVHWLPCPLVHAPDSVRYAMIPAGDLAADAE